MSNVCCPNWKSCALVRWNEQIKYHIWLVYKLFWQQCASQRLFSSHWKGTNGERINPPYTPYCKGNTSQVMLRIVPNPPVVNLHVTTRLAWMVSWRMSLIGRPCEQNLSFTKLTTSRTPGVSEAGYDLKLTWKEFPWEAYIWGINFLLLHPLLHYTTKQTRMNKQTRNEAISLQFEPSRVPFRVSNDNMITTATSLPQTFG